MKEGFSALNFKVGLQVSWTAQRPNELTEEPAEFDH